MKHLVPLIAALALATPAFAQEEAASVTPTSIVAGAPADGWRAIAPEDLLVMDLAPAADGSARRVVIQLIPPPFSQPWVKNIRTLARAHFWDGTSVNRVQDNYVTQWGDVTEAKPLPEGVVSPVADYTVQWCSYHVCPALPPVGNLGRRLTSEHGWNSFVEGWPIGELEGRSGTWPIHCYGAVGVGRNVAPDTGTGAELYTIIGQPQRHMDRNLAVVGRVIEGMAHLSALPRGSGELGFYTEEEADLRVPIVSVRLGSDLADAPRFEYLDTASESFARYVAVRANRNDAFYTVPAGGVDVCSVQVPVRRAG
ncbi:MAG: peptidylprolyl isomerase [Alteraurantiacibacter sp.]